MNYIESGMFKERAPKTVQQATLIFLLKGEAGKTKILLAMKKRGFGKGLLNGVGGKVEDETPEQAAVREANEEVEIEMKKFRKVGLIHFYFPNDPQRKDWNQDVHVYFCTQWDGEPNESEEMRPEWFDTDEIPFDQMWADDPFWLPIVLRGKKIEAWFSFDGKNEVKAHSVKEVDNI